MSYFLSPRKIIDELPLKEEMNIADFGCGSGGWVVPLAKKAKCGKIYALDVLKEALSALKSNTEMEKVYNIRTLRCNVERGTDLQSDYFELVILSNLLFQVEDKSAVIEEARRVLKKGGNLLVVDWAMKEDVTENLVDDKIKKAGFKLVKNLDAGKDHFGKLYEK